MKKVTALPRSAAILCIGIASTVSIAQAAPPTLTPNATETQLLLTWTPPPDDFGPRPPTCDLIDYTMVISYEGTNYGSFNRYNLPLQGGSGQCYFQRVINPLGGGIKMAPGTWMATATKSGSNAEIGSKTIYACTPAQGKQPMYWTRNSSITDNFYTLSTSQRDTSIGIGYSNRGVPFSMPTYAGRQVSQGFWRYYKGAPQFEHFYSTSSNDNTILSQNGYVYEGTEGYVFPTYKPGSVALYRYSLYNSASSDLQHLYTINRNDTAAAGMTYDGRVGYVCTP